MLIEKELNTAGALTGAGLGVAGDNGIHYKDTSKQPIPQLPCPLTISPNLWLAELLESELSLGPCLLKWSSLESLRGHLRRFHNMHVPCQNCQKFLHAKPMDNCFTFPGLICHNAGCALEPGSSRFENDGHLFYKVELTAVEGEFGIIEWFRTLDRSLPASIDPCEGSNGASRGTTTLNLGDSDISANQATISQRPSMPKILPYPQQSGTVYETLAANAAISLYQESRAATPRITPNPDEVPVIYDPPSLNAIVQNARHDALTLLDSTTTDLSSLHGDVDSSSYDAPPDSPPDLLKVIVYVTNYLRERPPTKYPLRLTYCQWKTLELLVARLDEMSKIDPAVTLAHTYALTREYDEHRRALFAVGSDSFDEAFDQILEPLLLWRRCEEPTGHLMSEWVAASKAYMRDECKSVSCPCEKYREVLQPRGDCVTALRNHSDSDADYLGFRACDKIRLISKRAGCYWEGQCFRTGQIGFFYQQDCA